MPQPSQASPPGTCPRSLAGTGRRVAAVHLAMRLTNYSLGLCHKCLDDLKHWCWLRPDGDSCSSRRRAARRLVRGRKSLANESAGRKDLPFHSEYRQGPKEGFMSEREGAGGVQTAVAIVGVLGIVCVIILASCAGLGLVYRSRIAAA